MQARLTTQAAQAKLIDGRGIASARRAAVRERALAFRAHFGRQPGLATILVGDDPASAVYVANKRQACAEAEIASWPHELPADISEAEVIALIDRLNADPDVDAILCQLPLPPGIDRDRVINRIRPEKDVDGLTAVNAGRLAVDLPGIRPCTPLGVMMLLAEIGVSLTGCYVVIIGHSNLVGKPMARLLLGAGATVTVCHHLTENLSDLTRQAEVLISATGRARLVKRDWVRPGAVVIDVGITRTLEGLVGDVDFDAVVHVAARITPVPGGVGPMTIVGLLTNTVEAAWAQQVSGGNVDGFQ